MNQSAKVYLDDDFLLDTEEKKEPFIPHINYQAVRWYEQYFAKMMKHFTFQLRLKNGDIYYVFSTVNQEEWEVRVQSRMTVQATRFLDKVNMEGVTIHNILSIRDVTQQVREQYEEQRRLIFDSFRLVEKIMEYDHTHFLRKMVQYVLDSRSNDESKRRFWRVVNEKYYGLDIHPLMEYEIEELEKILYYCQNPEEQSILSGVPVMKVAIAASSIATMGLIVYTYLFGK